MAVEVLQYNCSDGEERNRIVEFLEQLGSRPLSVSPENLDRLCLRLYPDRDTYYSLSEMESNSVFKFTTLDTLEGFLSRAVQMSSNWTRPPRS